MSPDFVIIGVCAESTKPDLAELFFAECRGGAAIAKIFRSCLRWACRLGAFEHVPGNLLTVPSTPPWSIWIPACLEAQSHSIYNAFFWKITAKLSVWSFSCPFTNARQWKELKILRTQNCRYSRPFLKEWLPRPFFKGLFCSFFQNNCVHFGTFSPSWFSSLSGRSS